MLTLQIIFESLLAILLIISSAVTLSAGRSCGRLRQERDTAFQMVALLNGVIRAAQNESAALDNALLRIRELTVAPTQGQPNASFPVGEDTDDKAPILNAQTLPRTAQPDRSPNSSRQNP